MKELSDEEVANYLANNPDFFLNHEAFLYKLKVSETQKGTISLVEKQLSVMRERHKKTRKRLKEVVETAKRNNEIFNKSQRLILNLIAAEDRDTFLSLLEKSLKKDFDCKAYALIIFGKPRQINHFTSVVEKQTAARHIGALMRAKEPTLGVLRPEEQKFLFGRQTRKVMSSALLPLKRKNKLIALLVIGSSDAHYFSSKMETLFIEFIADSVAKLLPRHMPRQS